MEQRLPVILTTKISTYGRLDYLSQLLAQIAPQANHKVFRQLGTGRDVNTVAPLKKLAQGFQRPQSCRFLIGMIERPVPDELRDPLLPDVFGLVDTTHINGEKRHRCFRDFDDR